MGTINVPVTPYIADFSASGIPCTDVVLSLTDVAPPEYIRLPDRPVTGSKYTSIDLTMMSTNFSVLASLGFGDFLSVNASSNIHCSYMDLAVTQKVERNSDARSIIASATFGLGFRLAIITYGLESSIAMNLSDVAAAAKLRMGHTSYQVMAIGGGLKVISTAQPLIANLAGEFNVETLELIGAVQAQLTDLYINKNSGMIPELMSVDIDLDKMASLYADHQGDEPVSYVNLMRSQRFALQQARKGHSLKQALEELKRRDDWKADRSIVKDLYVRVLGLKGADDRPSEQNARDVRLMLDAGAM